MHPHLFVFGPGYSAKPFMQKALEAGWQVSATFRRPETKAELDAIGISPYDFSETCGAPLAEDITHILTSIAPSRTGPISPTPEEADPVLALIHDQIKKLPNLQWMGYLSATNIYGDHGGAWVTEDTVPTPSLARGHRRLAAEQAWQKLADQKDIPLHIFRLAGIYGPGRNVVRSLLEGSARRIIKPGHMFSRIHVDDIGQALWLAANSKLKSEVFNLADDLPSAPALPVEIAADKLDIAPPAETLLDDAEMSPMARSFYQDNKKVSNKKVKDLLGLEFRYPTIHAAIPDLISIETKKQLG